ncbi:MAG: TRAP transporter small permease subunit, partial [Candidatus Atribacteria bacterium]|nr:TRAP transporter small permease subunit [Candidatus Atribacteria bacterium]
MKISKLLAKINMVLEKIEEVILCVGVSMLAIILIVNVIARKAGTSIYFIDEIAMFLVIWITFIGLSYAARKGRH